MTRSLTPRAMLSAFLRSFLIQGSWNYHTMIGTGFAFAMLPGLKLIFGGDEEAMEASVRRHLDHFNAHPYLSGIALGAALRLEADGTDPETVRRFKTAVRGPLGGLGDSLVWAAWLPAMSMAALTFWWLGAGVWPVVIFFLVLYNFGHVSLRMWGFRSGLREGRAVAAALGRARLSHLGRRLQHIATLLLGALAGAVIAGPGGLGDAGAPWVALAGTALCYTVDCAGGS